MALLLATPVLNSGGLIDFAKFTRRVSMRLAGIWLPGNGSRMKLPGLFGSGFVVNGLYAWTCPARFPANSASVAKCWNEFAAREYWNPSQAPKKKVLFLPLYSFGIT